MHTEHDHNLSDNSMGYYTSDIDLSDYFESDNHSTLRALEKSAYSWTADETTITESSCETGPHPETSVRKKKYTKTRAPTPHKTQATFSQKYTLSI